MAIRFLLGMRLLGLKEVLYYQGRINIIQKWVQELPRYQFEVIQCSHKMMEYMYVHNYFYEPKIATHLKLAAILRYEDKFIRPEAYNHTIFFTLDAPHTLENIELMQLTM